MRRGIWRGGAAALLALGGVGSQAHGAGYDTPILYSARHLGMGGTAISFVEDPSASFHNPAGLRGVEGLSWLGDCSLLLGKLRASPSPLEAVGSQAADLTVAPFFMAAAAYRATPWLSVGLAFYPVASGAARYEYELGGAPLVDETQILFLELTPTVSLNVPRDAVLPGDLSLGFGYRVNPLSFRRIRGDEDAPAIDLDRFGVGLGGFRVGHQYAPTPDFSVGLVYRNRVRVTTETEKGTVLNREATDGEFPFVLPSKFGAGFSYQINRLRLALDGEYALQSQNRQEALSGIVGGERIPVDNIFRWENGVTGRVGAEYALGAVRQYPVRVGYVFDSKVSNEAYPSAAGTPPTATHSVTGGVGYRGSSWETNFALAYRAGATTVSEEEHIGCTFCGSPGPYSLRLLGIYIDGSVDF